MAVTKLPGPTELRLVFNHSTLCESSQSHRGMLTGAELEHRDDSRTSACRLDLNGTKYQFGGKEARCIVFGHGLINCTSEQVHAISER